MGGFSGFFGDDDFVVLSTDNCPWYSPVIDTIYYDQRILSPSCFKGDCMYQLDVLEDGYVSVKKIDNVPMYNTSLIFTHWDELRTYLIKDLDVRWPIEEIELMVEEAGMFEDVEFK